MAVSTRGSDPRLRDDAELTRLAAAGDGAAFATLYDRHERRVFNFCERLLGSSHDAADATQETFLRVLKRLPKLEGRTIEFVPYLFTAARNACYDQIGRRKRAEPMAETPEPAPGSGEPGDLFVDPERAAMLSALQSDVHAANARLPERQREVLVLRELEELSYEDIGEIMGMKANAVAQLISRARIKLRDELRGDALASVASSSPECQRALPLLALEQDGQLEDSDDSDWLSAHLDDCDTCRVSRSAMQEAGLSYRAWLPVVPIAWLRQATIAKASELVGADWSAHAGGAHAHGGGGGGGAHGGGGGGVGESEPGTGGASSGGGTTGASVGGAGTGAGADGVTIGASVGAATAANSVIGTEGATDVADAAAIGPLTTTDRRRRRGRLLAGMLLALLLAGTLVGVVAATSGSSHHVTSTPVLSTAGAVSPGAGSTTAATGGKGVTGGARHGAHHARRVLRGGGSTTPLASLSPAVHISGSTLSTATPASGGGSNGGSTHRTGSTHHTSGSVGPPHGQGSPTTTSPPVVTTTAPPPPPPVQTTTQVTQTTQTTVASSSTPTCQTTAGIACP